LSDGGEHHPQIMSTSHHAPIVDAVEAGDAFQAVAVIQQHMALAAHRLANHADNR
jgi:DNA-binding GntR family transcriptional regulator